MRLESDWEGPDDQTLPGRGRSSSSSVDVVVVDSLITSRMTAAALAPSPGTPNEDWGEAWALATAELSNLAAVGPASLPSPGVPGEGESARRFSTARAGSRFFFCAATAAGREVDAGRDEVPEPFPSTRPSNSPI